MGLLLKLHLSSYVTRNTQDFSTANVIVLFLLRSGDERCHINLFNDYTASIYVNGNCKHKHIRPFFTCLGTQTVYQLIFQSKCAS